MSHYGQGWVMSNPLPQPFTLYIGYVLSINAQGQLVWVPTSATGAIVSNPPVGGLACTNIYFDTVSGQWVFQHA
jgi:hypothetical protein